MFGFLGYLLVRYGPKRPDPYASIEFLLRNFEIACGIGLGWRRRAEESEALLGRALAYLAHKLFDSVAVRELYDDIQQFLDEVGKEKKRERMEQGMRQSRIHARRAGSRGRNA